MPPTHRPWQQTLTRRASTAIAAIIATSVIVAPWSVSTAPAAHAQMTDQYADPASAEELRVVMNLLLQEHTYLVGGLTMATARGDTAAAQALQPEVDQNSEQLSQLLGSIYGANVEQAFREVWRNHVGYFVNYAQAAVLNDPNQLRQATQSLDQYARNIGQILGAANSSITAESVAGLFQSQAQQIARTIDQTVSNDPAQAFASLQTTARASYDISNPLSAAIVSQFPSRFPGDVGSDAANFRSNLNRLIQEHTLLAGYATTAAALGQTVTLQAVTPRIAQNSTQLTQLIGAVYGTSVEQRFGQLWNEHINGFVNYAQAARAKDQTQRQQALQGLERYRQEIGELLNQANPALTQAVVAQLFQPHVQHITAAIDAASQNNQALAWSELDIAAHHGREIALPVAEAIIAQFPNRFSTQQGAQTRGQ